MKSIEQIYKEYNIDKNRLKRDYINNPIKIVPRKNYGGTMKELPEREDAYYLYIELNMLREDLSIIFDRSESNLIKILREMGIKKDVKKIKENTRKKLLETEGIENVFQRKSVKDKILKTNLEKYGVEHYSSTSECRTKVKNTNLEMILTSLCDIAAQKGIISDDSITERDLFDTRLMGILTPRPSEVQNKFQSLYLQSPQKAT